MTEEWFDIRDEAEGKMVMVKRNKSFITAISFLKLWGSLGSDRTVV